MTVTETDDPNGVITLTGGTETARLDPNHLIAESTSCTLAGTNTIVVDKHLVIDGFYADTGWHYEMANGKRFGKGSNGNWVSGIVYDGFNIRGFTCNFVNWGNDALAAINQGNGGSVTWKNVRFEMRGTGRADFQIRDDDSTDYDIDGLEFSSELSNLENHRIQFDVGTIKNVTLVRGHLAIGGDGTIENLKFSGLGDSGTENRVFVLSAPVTYIGLEPWIESDGERLAFAVHQISVPTGDTRKRIFLDDTVLPTWWSWIDDVRMHKGLAVFQARYPFEITVLNDGSNLQDARVYVTSDDDSDSVDLNDVTDSSGVITGNETGGRMIAHIGEKTTDTSGYTALDVNHDKAVKTILIRKANINEITIAANIRRAGFITARVVSTDPAWVGPIATVAAYTGIDIDIATTTITITEDHTMQEIYDYVKWYMAEEDQMSESAFMEKDGTQMTFDGWTVEVDGAVFSPSDAIDNFIAGTVTLSNGGTITGGYKDDLGTRIIIRTTPVSSLLRIEEYEDDGTTFTQTVKGTSDADGNFGLVVASDARLRIYAKKWGYAFDRTDHDLADGAEADVSLVIIPHIDPARDISAYVGESASSNTDKIYFNWDSTNNKGDWVCGEINTSDQFIITAALLDNRITTQDGLEFFAWYNVQTGIDSHLQGAPFSWSHDRLEINEDHMQFLRIGGMLGTEISRLGANVKKKNGEDPYIAPVSANSRVQFDNLAILVPRSTLDDITTQTTDELERDGGPLDDVHGKTEQLIFVGDDVKATLDGELVNSNYEHFFVPDGIERRVYVYDRDKNRNRSLEWTFHADHTDIESLTWKDGLWYGIHNPSAGTISLGVYSAHGVRQTRHEFDLPSDLTDVQCSFILGDDLYVMDKSASARTIRVINLNTRQENTGASVDVSSFVENPLGMDFFEGLIYIADSRNLVTATRRVVAVSLTGGHDTDQSFDMHSGTILPTGIQVNAEHTFILDGTRDMIDTYNDSNTYVSSLDIPLVESNSDARALSVVKSQVNDVAGLRAELQRLLDLQIADIEVSSNSYVLKDSAGTTLYTFNRRSSTVSSDWSGGRTRA